MFTFLIIYSEIKNEKKGGGREGRIKVSDRLRATRIIGSKKSLTKEVEYCQVSMRY